MLSQHPVSLRGAMQEMYGLSAEDLEIQGRAASVMEELIPHETAAELNNGVPPDGVLARASARVRELGLQAINMPRDLGGGGFTMLQQVLVQEQTGRVTNALGWVIPAPAAWFPRFATDVQMERWVLPTIRGELHECYAITEEGSGSDVDALTATATRDGDRYVLNGVKWHVTSFNEAQYAFFQARLEEGVLGLVERRDVPLDAVEHVAVSIASRRRRQRVDVRPRPLLGDGVTLVQLTSDRGQHPPLHLHVGGDPGKPCGGSGDHPPQRVGHPSGLLLHEHLLEHGEPAATKVARHVDGLKAELTNPCRRACQDSIGGNAVVELGSGLVGDELLHDRCCASLDLEVLGAEAVHLLHRAPQGNGMLTKHSVYATL